MPGDDAKKELTKLAKGVEAERVAQAIDVVVKGQKKGRAPRASFSDLTSELIRVFRGPRGLSLRVYQQFLHTDEGSSARSKILDSVLRMIERESDLTGGGNQTDVGDMTEEEFADEIIGIVNGSQDQDLGDPTLEDDKARFDAAARAQEMEDPEAQEIEDDINRMEKREATETGAQKMNRLLTRLTEGKEKKGGKVNPEEAT